MTSTFRIGRVLWKSLALTFKNLLPLTALACLCSLPLLYLLIDAGADADAAAFATYGDGVFAIVIQIVFDALTRVVVVTGVVMIAQGHTLQMGRCLRLGVLGSRSALITALVLGAASHAAMSANLLLGLLVSLFMMVFFFVAVPIAVVERSDAMASLGRSCVLTKGVRLRIVGLSFLFGLVLMGVGVVYAIVDFEGAAAGLSVAGMFVTQVLSAALGAAISVLAYDELRQDKEGRSLDTVVAARIA